MIEKRAQGQKKFSTGAVRSRDADGERFDLISPVAIRRLAAVCHEGALKYSAHGWEKGMPVSDLLNHGLRHLFLYLRGDRDEDHLGHALWNIAAAIHSEELWSELNVGTLRRPGCLPPLADVEKPRTALSDGVPVALHAGWNKAAVLDFDTAGVVGPDVSNVLDGECLALAPAPVRFALQPDGSSGKSAMLACPVCGCDRVHLGPVDVEQGCLAVRCDHENADLTAIDQHGRSGSEVGIEFWCEAGHRFRYLFEFSHGTTTAKLESTEFNPSECSPDELWRD